MSSIRRTVTAVTLTDNEIIKRAWDVDQNFSILFYAIWVIMYVLTITPSALGVVPILSCKSVIFYYLVYEAVIRLINLDTHPVDEADIWTSQNWLLYSLRRVGVEYGISFLYSFTQSIYAVNWVLNLIPLGLSYLNAFIL